jgi:hypothetical protein
VTLLGPAAQVCVYVYTSLCATLWITVTELLWISQWISMTELWIRLWITVRELWISLGVFLLSPINHSGRTVFSL